MSTRNLNSVTQPITIRIRIKSIGSSLIGINIVTVVILNAIAQAITISIRIVGIGAGKEFLKVGQIVAVLIVASIVGSHEQAVVLFPEIRHAV